MGLSDLPQLQVSISQDNVLEGARGIISQVRPNWDLENSKFTVYTDGITNKLVGCRENSDTEQKDAILVRVYGDKTDLIIDRYLEQQNIVILNNAGLAKPLLAKFNNGIVYGFQPGKTLDMETVRDPTIGRWVAREMVRLHQVNPESVVSEADLDLIKVDRQPFVFNKMYTFLKHVPDEYAKPEQRRFKADVRSKQELTEEIEEMRKHMEALGSRVVLSHNDILLKNVIVNQADERAYLIDYEYGAFNYESYDIGNHFCEWAGIDEVDYDKYPSKEQQFAWLRAYLEEKWTLEGKDASKLTVNDEQLNALYAEVNKCALLAHLFWGLWGLVQARYSDIDFDYLDYAVIRLNEYFRRKDEFLALR